MTWKEILKIDMGEARRLGEKYAPRDMAEGRAEVQREKYSKKYDEHNRIYQKMNKKVRSLKDEISASRLDKYERMLLFLRGMRDRMGTERFDELYNPLKSMLNQEKYYIDNPKGRYQGSIY